MDKFLKFLAGFFGGLISSILFMFILKGRLLFRKIFFGVGAMAFLVAWVFNIYKSFKSKSPKAAWSFQFFESGILCFLLPVASVIYTGVFMVNKTQGGAEAVGAAIGGGLMTGISGVVGLFFGIVFLVLGFLTRDKN